MSKFKLDKRYYIEVHKRYFELIDSHVGQKHPAKHKDGSINKRAGKPMGLEKLGGFRDLNELLKRYSHECIRKAKTKQAKVEDLIDRISSIYNEFNNISATILNNAVEEALAKANK